MSLYVVNGESAANKQDKVYFDAAKRDHIPVKCIVEFVIFVEETRLICLIVMNVLPFTWFNCKLSILADPMNVF